MASVITWIKGIFAFVFMLLKSLIGLTETETEDTKRAVATAETAVAAAEAAAVVAASSAAAAQTTEQREQAFASVAAAEAAADTAVAAVAAAKAAVAADRLASHGLGYQALRASKGLAKLHALVRGYLARKYATASLYTMQAPIGGQAIVCSPINCRLTCNNTNGDIRGDKKVPGDIRRLSNSLKTSFDAVDESPKKLKVDPKYMAYSQSFKAKLRSDKAPKQRVELKVGQKKWLSNAPITSTKSICADKFIKENGNLPSYMTCTRSFKAKCRRIP